MKRGILAIAVLVLLLLLAAYWLLPAYVLPPMDVSQQPDDKTEPVSAVAPVTSYVSIPLALSVENIKKLVRDELSGKILTDIKVPGRNLRVSIKRNGTVALWIHDSEMHLVLPIAFRTHGDYNVKGELTLFTRASFDVSENWEPVVDARSTFRWDWQPRVGFWPFRFRIGDILAPYVQMALDKGAEDFRAQASGLYKLREMAQGGWDRLHGPHQLDTEAKTWLAMQPREIYMEPITSDDSEVRLNMWMGGELGIVQGNMPVAAEKVELPKLRHGAPPSKDFVLAAPLIVSYERMQASLREALVGQALPSASGSVTMSDLELYGSGRQVVLAVEFVGRKTGGLLPSRGRVYLVGEPFFDQGTRTLSVRKLQPTESSLNFLSHGSRWVLEEAPKWGEGIEQRMIWAAGPLLDEHQKALDGYLNHTVDHRFDLWGKVSELTVSGALPQPEGVMLQTQAKGGLELLFVP